MKIEALNILLVDDNPADARLIRETLTDSGAGALFNITEARTLKQAVKEAASANYDIILLDLTLPETSGMDTFLKVYETAPSTPVVVLTGLDDETMAAKAVRAGAQDYLVKGQADSHMLVRAIRFALERKRRTEERGARKLRSESMAHAQEERADLRMISASKSFKEVEEMVRTVAQTSNTSVLIQGETGTGKGLVANAIHFASNRRTHPFIEINCSAIPDTLLETEMFGYEKGAFTDAKQTKKGLFELADGGTVFLDEIGDMDMRMQPKLLKFLESRTFRKIGGTKDIKIDLRVIAATNRDLETLVSESRFREDLYYRLKVMVINLPPLRERKDDILPLARYFITTYESSLGVVKKLSPDCLPILMGYDWPGNVREVKNAMERATILSGSDDILPAHLPEELLRTSLAQTPVVDPSADMTLKEVEREHIKRVLATVNGNKSAASKILGISRLTLRKKLQDLDVPDVNDT
ncbi:MAG: sigma-54-dependent Fis family transcriptional regulator [Deltaproteobacteria bacterium]|nr:sigma-54-dependent Fis family transcriptional regulator [Deltaproteobacteria bacterium]